MMSTKSLTLHLHAPSGPLPLPALRMGCTASAVITECDPVLREQLVATLSELGIDVAGDAAIPAHARALIRSMRPDLVILDVDVAARMEDLATIAREAAQLGCRVLLTAGIPGSHEAADLIGAFPVIRKPFTATNIQQAVAQALNPP